MNPVEFISAGAGSGKTFRLTQILSQALGSGAALPHAILATTFTVKAATELRERARSRLLEERRIDLATALGQARLGTVNSVCAEMLRRFCFELGLSPDQTVLGERQAKHLMLATLAQTQEAADTSGLIRLSARLGVPPSDWGNSVEGIVKAARQNGISPDQLRAMGKRNADGMLGNWPAPRPDADVTDSLCEALSDAEAEVTLYIQTVQAGGGSVPKNLQTGLQEISRLARAFAAQRWTWSDWMAAAALDAGAKVRDKLEQVRKLGACHEAHPQFHADVRDYLDLVFRLAADALDTYDAAKRALGALDFGDQEVLLLQAIRDNADVRATLAAELDLVLVDEFQDTSPLQLAIFVELAKLAKRSVWVGDPKQAIFGFRGTDARLISEVLTAIKGWGGTIGEPLTTSRRSIASLVSLTNAVFEHAFEPQLQPEDVRLDSHRKDIPGQPALLNWNFESPNNDSDYLGLGPAVQGLIDSNYQVEEKATGQRRGIRPGDIAILCRKNDQVELAVSALARWGIPSASPRSGLLRTPEALLVLACLRRMADASDTVATALVLTLAESTPIQEWLTDRLDYLRAGEGPAYRWKLAGGSAHPLLSRLEQLRPRLDSLTPAEALCLAKAESQVAIAANRWSRSPQEARARVANVEALLALGRTYEDECTAAKRPATVGGLIQWLQTLADAGDDERATSSGDAVTVLTHHRAKGLEWPVVVLTSLSTKARSALWGVRARTEGTFDALQPLDNRFVHFWLNTWGKRKPPQSVLNAEGSEIGKAMMAEALAENARLLYVSMTRARDISVLVSCGRKGGPKREWVEEIKGATGIVFGDAGAVKLPGGRTIARVSNTWTQEECALQRPLPPDVGCSWFVPGAPSAREPLWFRPSEAGVGAFVRRQSVEIGARVALRHTTDMANLGTALHLCIAHACIHGETRSEDLRRILDTWGVTTAVDQPAVEAQISAFQAWIRSRWPVAKVHVEFPIEADRPDGKRLRGRADLLVETADGWILVDHKSNPGGTDRVDALVAEHGPQLAAYAEAVNACSEKRVTECWIYLPVAGRAVEVGVAQAVTSGMSAGV